MLLWLLVSSAFAWRSALYPVGWTPGLTDAEGRGLSDFSHAGYHRGEDPLPTSVPGLVVDVTAAPYLADPTGTADATAAIQQAIDDVSAAGGGTVQVPAGTYVVSRPTGSDCALQINGSGVLLQGAGSASTFLHHTTTSMRFGRVICARPRRDSDWIWTWNTFDEQLLTADAAAGDLVVRVADSSGFAVGERLVVRADPTLDWIADHGMTGTWDPLTMGGPASLREVVAIDAASHTLSLDAPLGTPLLVRDAARVGRTEPHLSEVGIEGLSIGMTANPLGGLGDEDYDTPGTAAYEVHAGFAVVVNHVVDGWVRDVKSYEPPGNASDVHLLSGGLRLYYSAHVTVEACDLRHPQYLGEGGNGYLFVHSGHDNLITGSYARGGRHNLSHSLPHTTGNVTHRSTFVDGRLPVDFHMWLSAANLLDNVALDGDSIEAIFRDCCGHGHSTTESVVWNTEGRAYPSGQWPLFHIVESQQYGWGYVIGTRGPADQVRTPGGGGAAPTDWVEGVGTADTLEPVSLYEDQLALRLGPSAATGDTGSAGDPTGHTGGTGTPEDTAADTGTAPKGEDPLPRDEPRGCGCAQTGATGSGVFWLVLLLHGISRRVLAVRVAP